MPAPRAAGRAGCPARPMRSRCGMRWALDPERREAFVLTQVLGVPYAEAAQVCGCPVGTVRSRVARARSDLAGLLREEEPPGDGLSHAE